MLDSTISCEKISMIFFNLKVLIWKFCFCFAVWSQNTVIINSTTHGGAIGLDNNLWDLIFSKHLPYITHFPSKDNCWVEGIRIKRQPSCINIPHQYITIYHKWHQYTTAVASSNMLSPFLQAWWCQYPLSSHFGEVAKKGWYMRSNSRRYTLFCGIKWSLSFFFFF